jgi:hypothetical protein
LTARKRPAFFNALFRRETNAEKHETEQKNRRRAGAESVRAPPNGSTKAERRDEITIYWLIRSSTWGYPNALESGSEKNIRFGDLLLAPKVHHQTSLGQ